MPKDWRPERPPTACTLSIDGRPYPAGAGWSVAAALIAHGHAQCRCNAAGQPRGPFCMTGACFDCLVEIDGVPGCQACQTPVADGMRIVLGGMTKT